MSLVFLKLSFWLAFWELGFHKDSCIALRVCISGGGSPSVMAWPGQEVSGSFTDPTSLSLLCPQEPRMCEFGPQPRCGATWGTP